MRFDRIASLVVAAACVVPIGAQQPARDALPSLAGAAAATVRGRIVMSDSGAPLAAAFVAPTNNSSLGVTTDNDGRYEIGGLPAGKVVLRASKLGYAPASYSFRLPAEQSREIDLAAGQTLTGVDFVFANGGVIVVRVLNQRGDPASGIRVGAQRFKYSSGDRRVMGAAALTNDLGEARIYGLPAGDYYVISASGQPISSDPGYGYFYYPGTAFMAQAQAVSVTAGQESAVVMSLVRSAVADVTGSIRGADGLSFPQLPLVVSAFPHGSAQHTHIAIRRLPDGGFSIPRLAPGQYLVQVNPDAELPATEMQYVWLPFELNGEPLAVTASATRGGALRGRVVSDTGEPLAGISPKSIKLALTATTYPENERQPEVTVRGDWTFAAETVVNARVVRLPEPAGGWYLKAVTFEDRDITDTPVDFTNGATLSDVQVVLTRQPTIVAGAIEGVPTPRHAVVFYSGDPVHWTLDSRRVAMARVDSNGRFAARGLPPGRYLAVAVNDLDTGEERDPTLLQRLRPQATAFELTAGAAVTINLKTIQ